MREGLPDSRPAGPRTTTEVEWTELPPRGNRGRLRTPDPLWAELRANPGRWAVYGRGYANSSVVTQIRAGERNGIEPGEFEVESRKQPDGTVTIYVSYPE